MDADLPALPYLSADASIPIDRPFTRRTALAEAVTDRQLSAWTTAGLLVHPIRGVYYAAQIPDTLDLRCACIQLVVGDDAVITDRTAARLHGAWQALAPNDHLVVPRASVFCVPGNRLRNGFVASGGRRLSPGDVMEINGLRVTTPLRTACDCGRLLHRDQAFCALDALLGLGEFTRDELVHAIGRFKGYRRVRQLRELAPRADGRAQSQGESVLRLRWDDAGLPPAELQWEVAGPEGPLFLDLALPDLRFAAEYDGEAFHGPEQEQHDLQRRAWIAAEHGFVFVVARKHHVFGPHQDITGRLYAGLRKVGFELGGRPQSR